MGHLAARAGRAAVPSLAARAGRAAVASLVALALLCACAGRPVPNVLLVVVDTLRADHTSAYGYARDTTPRLRALAEQGVRFENAYAPVGLTAPSHASLFTSLHPLTHGVVRNGLALGDEHVTLAEYLAVRGYQTAAVVSSFVLDREFGLGQGFAFYDDHFDPAEATVELAEWEGHAVGEAFDRRADHTTRRAVAWLRETRSADSPFFLFVHYFDPHAPYTPPASAAARFAPEGPGPAAEVAAYDAEIAFTDAAIGRLLDALDELGLADATLVVVTADHGEGLMQRGYMLHGLSVHEEELRVPLLLRWPAQLPAGRSVAEPVSVLDLEPTLAELVPIGRTGIASEGHSFAAALRGAGGLDAERPIFVYRRDFGPEPVRPAVVGEEPGAQARVSVAGRQYGLREGRWKYVIAPLEGPPALYDLEADPGELHDLSAREAGQARRLGEQLEAWLGVHAQPLPAAGTPSAEDRARLEALGYAE
jgi:choline-sulfatase